MSVRQSEGRPAAGIVYLVGAGPGDPGLLTVRAAELLRAADVVAHDELVAPAILNLAPASAERLPVGRRQGSGKIDYRLHPAVLDRARRGLRVVRLKSGDPLIFGRGGEEAEELAEQGIPFEIVPGISAALGAAAYAGIPLTHRHVSSGVLLATGHEAEGSASGSAAGSHENVVLVAPRAPGASPARDRTLVLYMAARRVRPTLRRLVDEGFPASTPAAYVAAATTPAQEVVVGTLADLADAIPPPSTAGRPPGLLIVGEVVRLRSRLAWFGVTDRSTT
ncbi:MAG TPA: uroporphyrinogen-III C-methyltransferase [Polyangia bacterium]|nr:uroporphyrinogen-III C-methyltransferase [Polyangia bacterium]